VLLISTPCPSRTTRRRDRLYRLVTRLLSVALLPLAVVMARRRARQVACQWALAARFPAENLDGLTAATRAAFEAARTDALWRHGELIGLTDGYRDAQAQARLFADAVRRTGSPALAMNWTLPPDQSSHVAGTALDVRPLEGARWLERYGSRHHLYRVYDNEWAGCLFLVVAASPPEESLPPFVDSPFASSIAPGVFAQQGIDGWQGLLFMAVPVAVTAVGLCLLRWWPYLLAAAGLMAVPGVLSDWEWSIRYPVAVGYVVNLLPTAAYILAIVALLACAQGLYRASPAWCAVVVALAVGSRLMGSAMMAGISWELGSDHPAAWHTALLAAGLAGRGGGSA
jgi:D-alanyl-D-alanine carboxypeptidase